MDFVSREKIARLVKNKTDFPYTSCSGSAPSTRESSRLPRKSAQLFCFFDRARAHRGVRAGSSPTGEPPSLATMEQGTARRNADGLSANSGRSGSGGEGGGSGGDKEVRRQQSPRAFRFYARRARAPATASAARRPPYPR